MTFRTHVHLVLASIVLAISSAAYAENDVTRESLFPRCGGVVNLCGYYDRATNDEVITPVYERAMQFSEGLAAVRINGEFGYIDRSGSLVIHPQFDMAGPFYQGLAEVLIDGSTGVIDHSGNIVVDPQFSRAIPFTKDTLLVSKGPFRQSRLPGHERYDNLKSGVSYFGPEAFGLFHVRYGWIKHPVFKLNIFEAEGRGLIWATEGTGPRKPWGLLRADGTWQVQPIFVHVQRLMEDRAVVRTSTSRQGRPALSGAVDRDGQLVVPVKFDWLGYWSDGFGLARKDGKEGLVHKDGRLVGDRYFEKVERNYSRGVAPRVYDGSKWMTVSPDGSLVKDQLTETTALECPSGLKLVHAESGGLKVVKPDGRPAAPYAFERQHYDKRNCDSPLSVSFKGKFGFVTQEGLMITDPPFFDNTYRFNDGFAAVQINGLWGIVSLQGEMVVAPTYQKMRPANGAYEVELAGRKHWISARGIEVAEPAKDSTQTRNSVIKCAGGAEMFEVDGKWGLIGPDRTTIIEPEYRAISCFKNGVVWVPDEAKKAWCPLGRDGTPQGKPACLQTYYAVWWSHHYPEQLHPDPYESSVLWNRALLDYGVGKTFEPPNMIGDGVRGRGRRPAVHSR